MSINTNAPVRSPWPAAQERIDVLGVKNFTAKITDHGWCLVTIPNGKVVIIIRVIGSHSEEINTPERVVFGVLSQVATHRPEAPVYDVDGNQLMIGTNEDQWTVYLDPSENPISTIYAEQWRSADYKLRPSDPEYKKLPPRKKVVVDHKRLIEWLNENPDQATY